MAEIVLLILILSISALFFIIRSNLKKIKDNKVVAKNIAPETKTSKPISSCQSGRSSPANTDSIVKSTGDGWILNPQSTFPLTIYGIDQSVAEETKQILENVYTTGIHEITKNIIPIVARQNLRCKEVDDYVKKFKPIYLKKIEEQKQTSPEWATASNLDKRDLLYEFKNNAIVQLDVQPYCNLEILFEADLSDLTVDDVLIDRYGYEVIRFYLSRKKGVHTVPADHYDRKMFEKLTEVGLAVRGENIHFEYILESLKLKELSALVEDLNPPKFSRKAKAIEYLLNLPDLKERLNKSISYRSLFQVQSLPKEFENLDLEKISLSWQYAHELSTLICLTYYYSGSARKQPDEDTKAMSKGWEISNIDDGCSYCKRAASKKYPKNNYPIVPLHIGCRCTVMPILDIE